MKKILLLSFFLFSQIILSAEIEIYGPCSSRPILKTQWESSARNVGLFTVQVLDYFGIQYIGNAESIESIQGTPTGMDAIEVVNDHHMRAYGWCYEVDGRQPSKMPHRVRMKGKKHIKWFFAFSSYKRGQWSDYCTPAHTIKPRFLCQ